MKIQKIIESSTLQRVIEYEISTEKMRSLPHTFGNFRDENEFHSAFFDQNHPNHSEAYEILEHVLKPDAEPKEYQTLSQVRYKSFRSI